MAGYIAGPDSVFKTGGEVGPGMNPAAFSGMLFVACWSKHCFFSLCLSIFHFSVVVEVLVCTLGPATDPASPQGWTRHRLYMYRA